MEPIMFTVDNLPADPDHKSEALVVTIDIIRVDVQRVMIDTGSSINV